MADNFLTKKRTNILFFFKLDPPISEDQIFRNFWKKNPLFCKKILCFFQKKIRFFNPLFVLRAFRHTFSGIISNMKFKRELEKNNYNIIYIILKLRKDPLNSPIFFF
jgi:hypothetical protein